METLYEAYQLVHEVLSKYKNHIMYSIEHVTWEYDYGLIKEKTNRNVYDWLTVMTIYHFNEIAVCNEFLRYDSYCIGILKSFMSIF